MYCSHGKVIILYKIYDRRKCYVHEKNHLHSKPLIINIFKTRQNDNKRTTYLAKTT